MVVGGRGNASKAGAGPLAGSGLSWKADEEATGVGAAAAGGGAGVPNALLSNANSSAAGLAAGRTGLGGGALEPAEGLVMGGKVWGFSKALLSKLNSSAEKKPRDLVSALISRAEIMRTKMYGFAW